jgi:hypothetical protein
MNIMAWFSRPVSAYIPVQDVMTFWQQNSGRPAFVLPQHLPPSSVPSGLYMVDKGVSNMIGIDHVRQSNA